MKHKTYKGLVMKVTDKEIVLLQDDGTFKNISRKAVDDLPLLGQSFTHVEKKTSFHLLSTLAIAAVFFLTFLSFSLFQSDEPTYLVVVDINPSIEMEVNDKQEVVEIRALNKDGERILSSIHKDDRDVLHVMGLIVKEATKQGYLTRSPMISASLISINKGQWLPVKEIENTVRSSLSNSEVEVLVKEETFNLYEEAKKLHLTVNYYQQYKSLVEKEIVTDIKDIKGKTMAELNELEKKETKSRSQPNNDDSSEKVETEEAKKSTQKSSTNKDSGSNSHDYREKANNPEKPKEVKEKKQKETDKQKDTMQEQKSKTNTEKNSKASEAQEEEKQQEEKEKEKQETSNQKSQQGKNGNSESIINKEPSARPNNPEDNREKKEKDS